jgi:polar amino acid transport system substrate-binding protein
MRAHLILRSIAKRCVSKDGRQTRCSFPPFETHAFGALLRVRLFCVLAVFTALFAFSPARAATPDAALAELLKEARARLPAACTQPNVDRLIKILCAKKIRIGIRDYYPLFAERKGDRREGYEVDVALAIGRMLGVDVDFVRVNAATRIPLLAEDRIDLAIATMGHNTQRDGQVRFIRPHYYRSETTVVGPRELPVASMLDLPGRTVCVTVGNGSNAELVSQGARLMLFDEAGVLPDRLKDQTCTLAAQDDSFFAKYFTDEDFNARYFQKFGFAQVPWGMAVARQGSAELARALDLISQVFHRDGLFIDIGRLHSIRLGFLQQQQQVWRNPECNTDAGSANPSCVLPPLNTALQPTSFAADVTSLENWVDARTGIDLTLPMLKTAPAWSLFKDGVVYSLVLIAGALVATLAFALVLGAAMGSRSFLLRWPARLVTMALQSSPIVLTLVIAATVTHGLFALSTETVLGAAIVALGLANGSNAGQAIGEAIWSLRAEGMQGGLFGRALSRAATQIVAFLINAAKGTPIASFIGAPELLSSLTDITSFASGRVTTYSILLIFYTAVVLVVVWLCGKLKQVLEHRQAAA